MKAGRDSGSSVKATIVRLYYTWHGNFFKENSVV